MGCKFLSVDQDDNGKELYHCTYAHVEVYGSSLNCCTSYDPYDVCGYLRDFLTADKVNAIVSIISGGIQNSKTEMNGLLKYLGNEAARTNYNKLHKLVQKTAMHRFDFSEIYIHFSGPVSEGDRGPLYEVNEVNLDNRVKALIYSLNDTTNRGKMIRPISSRRLNVSVEDLSRIVNVFDQSKGKIYNCLTCGDLASLSNCYADKALEIMGKVKNIVEAYFNEMEKELSKMRVDFSRKMGGVINAAKRDRGKTLDHTNVKWKDF